MARKLRQGVVQQVAKDVGSRVGRHLRCPLGVDLLYCSGGWGRNGGGPTRGGVRVKASERAVGKERLGDGQGLSVAPVLHMSLGVEQRWGRGGRQNQSTPVPLSCYQSVRSCQTQLYCCDMDTTRDRVLLTKCECLR